MSGLTQIPTFQSPLASTEDLWRLCLEEISSKQKMRTYFDWHSFTNWLKLFQGLCLWLPSPWRYRCTIFTSSSGFWRRVSRECWESWRATNHLSTTPGSLVRVTNTSPREFVITQSRDEDKSNFRDTRTTQIGHNTPRRPEIIDNFKTYKSIITNKIDKLAREGPDRHSTAFTP